MSQRGHPLATNSNVLRPVDLGPSFPISRGSSRNASRSPVSSGFANGNGAPKKVLFEADDSDPEDNFDGMGDGRPGLFTRPSDGRSQQPLLHKDDDERGRTGYNADGTADPAMLERRASTFDRRSTMRSRSPDTQAKLATRQKYTYAAFFLVLSLVSFVIQTETAVYIQSELGWNKAYCML
jgi:hypothetical protein